jgi:DNA-directed RNA polymerase specialized sigma24 family protein
MGESLLTQVLPFVGVAIGYVVAKFRVAEEAASDLVHGVLASLLTKRSERLGNPKRYLLRACRWRALQLYRNKQQRNETRAIPQISAFSIPEAPEVLVALEDEDKERFFGRDTPAERQITELTRDGQSLVEISGMLEIPASTVRMRLQLTCKGLSHLAS